MVGDIIKVGEAEYEVVWDGESGLPLLPPRESRVHDTWEAPTRPYNKTGRHTRKNKPDHGVEVLPDPDQSMLPSVGPEVLENGQING